MTRHPFARTLRNVVRLVAAVICAVTLFFAVLWAAYLLWNQPIELGSGRIVRRVGVLIDSSATMREDFDRAKQLIIERIVSSLGPGDQLAAYRVGSGFTESANMIVNSSLGEIPERLLEPSIARLVRTDVLTELRKRADATVQRERWIQRINGIAMEPTSGTSDYQSAFGYMAKRLGPDAGDGRIQRELLVIGDLEQDPAPRSFVPLEPLETETELYSGVEVTLVYPFRATTKQTEARQRAFSLYWAEFFQARGASVSVVTFDDQQPLVALNILRARSLQRQE